MKTLDWSKQVGWPSQRHPLSAAVPAELQAGLLRTVSSGSLIVCLKTQVFTTVLVAARGTCGVSAAAARGGRDGVRVRRCRPA